MKTYNFENKTFEDLFDYALKLAKEKSKYCKDFFNAYINYILEKNTELTLKDATKRAKDNFGYWAGYYGDEIRKLIADTYNALHPYFGDNYNISSFEAFRIGEDKALGIKVKDDYNA